MTHASRASLIRRCAALWILLHCEILLAAPPSQAAARLLILCDQAHAEVVVALGQGPGGGEIRGRANTEITLPPGTHRVEVHAEGQEQVPFTVTLRPGQLLRRSVDLRATPERREIGRLRIKLSRRIQGQDRPEAPDPYDLRILRGEDEQVEEECLLTELPERDLRSGSYVIEIQRRGRSEVLARKTIDLSPGLTVLPIVLGGSLTIESYPRDAEVSLDGQIVGRTPYTLSDPTPYIPYRYMVTHKNKGIVSGEVTFQPGEDQVLVLERKVQPTRPLWQMSPLSALTLSPGNMALLLGGGYPHLAVAQISVGVVRRWHLGVDIGAEVGTRGDGGLIRGHGRLLVLDAARVPIAVATNLVIGYRSGQHGQDGYEMETGVAVSWLPLRRLSLTVHSSLQIYSDRLSPGLVNRDFGARWLQRAVLEGSVHDRVSLWILAEGAPQQRDAYKSTFNQANPFGQRIAWQRDPDIEFPASLRGGVTVFVGKRP